MRTIFSILVSLLLVSPAAAAQQAALQPADEVASIEPNAIACRNHAAARTAADALQNEEFLSARELILQHRLDGLCGTTRLPDDFDSPVAIADEGANISSGKPTMDGRSTLIYEIPIGHERNHEDHSVFIMLLSRD